MIKTYFCDLIWCDRSWPFDDLIIFSRTFEEHVGRLQQVVRCLTDNNLKLSPKMCSFLEKARYVGHIVSKAGIEPDPDKVEPTPTTPDQVRQFLGFSKNSRPLSGVMTPPTKKSRKNTKIPRIMALGRETTASIRPSETASITTTHIRIPGFFSAIRTIYRRITQRIGCSTLPITD